MRRVGTLRRVGSFAAVLIWAALAAADDARPWVEQAAARGATVYQRCAACHSLQRNRAGPMHCGVVGRPAGAVPGFGYSAALRQSGIVWTEDSLDQFLAGPLAMVPGTTMGIAGIPNEDDRRSIIEYLKYASTELCDGNSR